MHKLYCLNKNEKIDITPIVKTISWRSNVNELGQELDFSVTNSDMKYFPKNPVDIGSMMILQNNKEILRSIVVTENKIGRDLIDYVSFDYTFYLNKGSETYQFNKIAASKAIEKILKDFNIHVGSIANIPVVINKIYHDDVLSDVLKDIIETVRKETGIKYIMEFRDGKFYLEKESEKIIKASFKLADNIKEESILSSISNQTIKRSIENMKNSIKIISTSDKKDTVHYNAKKQEFIDKYGLLQKIHIISKEDISKAKNIADNMLSDLGKVLIEQSIEVPGNDEVRSGRILELKEELTGANKKYLIKDCLHTLEDGIHTMKLNMEVV